MTKEFIDESTFHVNREDIPYFSLGYRLNSDVPFRLSFEDLRTGVVVGVSNHNQSEKFIKMLLRGLTTFHSNKCIETHMTTLHDDTKELAKTFTLDVHKQYDSNGSIISLIKQLNYEIKLRESLFNSYDVGNLRAYHQLTSEQAPQVEYKLVILDDLDTLIDKDFMLKDIMRIFHKGADLGIILIGMTRFSDLDILQHLLTVAKQRIIFETQNESDSECMIRYGDAMQLKNYEFIYYNKERIQTMTVFGQL